MPYKHAILGGTFDRLHKGHKKLIKAALANSEKITIGLTSDVMAAGKKSHYPITNYELRHGELVDYLRSAGDLRKITIQKISDIYGPAIFDKDVDVIFATKATMHNAKKVIEARNNKKLSNIEMVIVDEIVADDGEILSSERIRAGEINRSGNSYYKLLKKSDKYMLPDTLREELKKPFGEVMEENDFYNLPNKPIITVGDVATAKSIIVGTVPDISIFDLKTNRNTIDDKNILGNLPSSFSEINNPAGTITRESIDQINNNIKENKSGIKSAIKVLGEEDLLTLPCVLLAPLGTIIIYGLSGIGGIKITVTEKKKEEFVEILKRLMTI